MSKKLEKSYLGFISEIKQSIIKSRYQAARLANKEQLLLYIHIGKRLSEKIETERWGSKVLVQISQDLQNELPGLRGFSERSLKNMRQFADEYFTTLFGQSATAQINSSIRQSATAQLTKAGKSRELKEKQAKTFFGISFTHHIILLNKCKALTERFFYMEMAAGEMQSVSVMEHHIEANTFKKLGKLPNNFKTALPVNMRSSALNTFKDEYLFDFMNLDDDHDEKVFEEAAVANIRKFIMSIGKGFSFIGNQYKIELGEKEYFIDLLFYNRILQSLVVFELKRGKFKPEYAGKLNFYLNVLDDTVKLKNEKPSIGIILCKEKDNTEVEYSFKSINKAMGVATYKLSTEVPKEMKGVLPDAKSLRKLLQ